jgi:dTDP-4-dehydrorhamnose reductase
MANGRQEALKKKLEQNFADKKFMIIGASGALGMEFLKALGSKYAIAVVRRPRTSFLEHLQEWMNEEEYQETKDVEVQNFDLQFSAMEGLEDFLKENAKRKDLAGIFYCAGETDAYSCARFPERAFRLNTIVPVQIANAFSQVPFFYISTGDVFSIPSSALTEYDFMGRGYSELDDPIPTTIYGLSKLCGEQLLLFSSLKNTIVVRIAFLFSKFPSIGKLNSPKPRLHFPLTILSKLMKGEKIELPGIPISISYGPDIVEALLGGFERFNLHSNDGKQILAGSVQPSTFRSLRLKLLEKDRLIHLINFASIAETLYSIANKVAFLNGFPISEIKEIKLSKASYFDNLTGELLPVSRLLRAAPFSLGCSMPTVDSALQRFFHEDFPGSKLQEKLFSNFEPKSGDPNCKLVK